jgi:protocatechuate 3,4-dioxygenase beta subunit
MRGSLQALYTRIYFSDEQNEHDKLLNAVDASRRTNINCAAKRSKRQASHIILIYTCRVKMKPYFLKYRST